MAQPRREAMAARGGLSHLLGTLEDLQRPSSPSGLDPRFSSSSGWIFFPELNKVRAIYKPRKPPVEGEAEPPRKWARPASLPSFGLASVSSFAGSLLAYSRVYVLHDCTPLDVVILEISSRKG